MAKSLFRTLVTLSGVAITKNVLAQPGSGTAMQAAIDAALAAAGTGAAFQSASELGGKPADYQIAVAVSPTTDVMPRSLIQVSFRNASGSGGTTPAPLLIISNAQTTSGVTTTASDLAIALANSNGGGAVPNQANQMGCVDIDTTE